MVDAFEGIKRLFRKYDVNEEVVKVLDEREKKIAAAPPDEYTSPKYKAELLDEIERLRVAVPHIWVPQGHVDKYMRDDIRETILRFRDNIDTKIAMKVETINSNDFWWTPTLHLETETLLWEIRGVLNKATLINWKMTKALIWAVIKALLYLGIVVGLLFVSQNHFETRVIAILVLIYNSVRYEGGMLGLNIMGFEIDTLDELGQISRALKMKVPTNLTRNDTYGMGMTLIHVRCLGLLVADVIAFIGLISSFL